MPYAIQIGAACDGCAISVRSEWVSGPCSDDQLHTLFSQQLRERGWVVAGKVLHCPTCASPTLAREVWRGVAEGVSWAEVAAQVKSQWTASGLQALLLSRYGELPALSQASESSRGSGKSSTSASAI